MAYEFTASGAVHAPALRGESPFDREPDDDARTFAFAFARFSSPSDLRRRNAAGRNTFNYGLVLSLRFQDYEIVSDPEDPTAPPGPEDVLFRDLRVIATDLWFRFNHGHFRLELAGVYMPGELLATTTPGFELRQHLTSNQWGAVIQAAWEPPTGFGADLEIGVASGDDAPGFGVRLREDQAGTVPGDLDGPQFRYPEDLTIDNFRFHPNHRVDLILWRRIIGAITDAVYARARAWYVWRSLRLESWVTFSSALREPTTPGDSRLLGLEWDTTLTWAIDRGIAITGAYGLLVPFAGLANPALGIDSAELAHAGHVVISWSF